ncbi:dual specificity [Trichuris trichiura]|uniref:dual-specificity kinase n=1 Tax=Trichuris trichiura TaxID=36087 RepID=A0A077Z0P9_TRITR|nr:dual specificity [Trichuris trichiura]
MALQSETIVESRPPPAKVYSGSKSCCLFPPLDGGRNGIISLQNLHLGSDNSPNDQPPPSRNSQEKRDVANKVNEADATKVVGDTVAAAGERSTQQADRFIKPDHAITLYSSKLTSYEQSEIIHYPQIYFIGDAVKKHRAPLEPANNYGFDDDDGFYILMPRDHVAYRYEVLKVIGKGSFGQVVKAFDHKTQKCVALKIVRNEKRFHRQTDVEIRILDMLRTNDAENHSNTVRMLDHFTFRQHKCITFELLSFNLYEVIKINRFRGLGLPLVRKFACGILQCLEMLQRHRLIHCDLKPENILLRHPSRSGIKVIDFGSSCFVDHSVYTYIQSRFYRAPEVILGCKYGMAIDMWSFGCILCELHTGVPLFPGEDEMDQMSLVMELLGMPPAKLLAKSKRAKYFITSKGFPRYCTMVTLPDGSTGLKGYRSRRGKPRGAPSSRSWSSALKGCDDENFIDFVKRCLEWDPDERMTPSQALKHCWIRKKNVHSVVADSAAAKSMDKADQRTTVREVGEKGSSISGNNCTCTAAAANGLNGERLKLPVL